MNQDFKNITKIAKDVNFPSSITNIEMVYDLANFILEKKIELSSKQQENLLNVMDTSSNIYKEFMNLIYEKHDSALENSNQMDIKYTDELIRTYNPSQESKDKGYLDDNISKNKRSEIREKFRGITTQIVVTISTIAVGLVLNNITKSKPFWHK